MTRRLAGAVAACVLIASACSDSGDTSTPATSPGVSALTSVNDYVDAFEDVRPAPLVTSAFPDLAKADAYAFQDAYADALNPTGEPRLGFKTGCAGNCPFIDAVPIFGVLLASMRVEDGVTIPRSDFVRGLAESEIAFTFGEDVSAPATIGEIKAAVATVSPAVELPDEFFVPEPDEVPIDDVIAVDAIARHVLVGAPVDPSTLDVNAVVATARLNGAVIWEEPATNILGDQWKALVLLVDLLEERGLGIERGDTVITGTLNTPFPLEPGSYAIDYGALGTLTFAVSDN